MALPIESSSKAAIIQESPAAAEVSESIMIEESSTALVLGKPDADQDVGKEQQLKPELEQSKDVAESQSPKHSDSGAAEVVKEESEH